MLTSSAAVAGALCNAVRLVDEPAEKIRAELRLFLLRLLPGRFLGLLLRAYHWRNFPRASRPFLAASSAAFFAISVYNPF